MKKKTKQKKRLTRLKRLTATEMSSLNNDALYLFFFIFAILFSRNYVFKKIMHKNKSLEVFGVFFSFL